MRDDRILQLSGLASEQWGLFTSSQAKALDVTAQQLARLANTGVIERLRHGVYRLTGVPEDPRTSLRAAWLALDPAALVRDRYNNPEQSVVSHRSAAWVHGLGDLEADELEFSVPVRRQSRHRGTRFYLRELKQQDWELVEGLPVTTVLATVRDLAQSGLDGGHLAGVVRDALVDAHVDLPALAEVLRPYAHRYGSRLGDGAAFVEDLLDQAGVPTSALDTAAAVSSRQVREADQLLRSPAVLESLRVLQSPALRANLGQLDQLTAQTAIAAAVQQLAAVQGIPPAISASAAASAAAQRLAAVTGGEALSQALRAATAPASQALQAAGSAAITKQVAKATAQLRQLPLGTTSPLLSPQLAETLRRSASAAVDDAATALAAASQTARGSGQIDTHPETSED